MLLERELLERGGSSYSREGVYLYFNPSIGPQGTTYLIDHQQTVNHGLRFRQYYLRTHVVLACTFRKKLAYNTLTGLGVQYTDVHCWAPLL